jgi:hypothetical protein
MSPILTEMVFKQDWEIQEAIRNSMLEAIEKINQQEVVTRT